MITQNARHAVAQHAEACEETSEEEIAACSTAGTIPSKPACSQGRGQLRAHVCSHPLLSNQPRLTLDDKEDYFHYFLKNKPVGRIDQRTIEIDCNTAIDEGLYTFNFEKTGTEIKSRYTFMYKWDGYDWLITNHHSSALPPGE